MNKVVTRIRNSTSGQYLIRNKKYAPIVFFIGGFVFDSLTLGRIDRAYDLTMLCLHMSSLSFMIYAFNLAEDGRWKNTFLERFEEYFPLAIQFFFGALSSAYVIYFSRSVSLSKTVSFFSIIVILFITNEFLKRKLSNKYLQFSVYSFISFTFFTFMIPVFIKQMNTVVFVVSGLISMACTLALVRKVYLRSASTRRQVHLGKLLSLVVGIYSLIYVFYFFKLIPPVPLALKSGLVGHQVKYEDGKYSVLYEKDEWHVFWRAHRLKLLWRPNEKVYVFTSIFAPTNLEKEVYHRWKWYNVSLEEWEVVEDIGINVRGGRTDGYRGYTYKHWVKPGRWEVEVITEEGLVLGMVDFEIVKTREGATRNTAVKVF
ncbi:MAG: DUF2914 domain-containing protein [Reichenbachiella sp.]|uniref:DUF2914 domain-containing protein n=1 Tax=Reichenbachiella sp. TaxID=2184521 RepID=UPI0029663D9A|nr:DUF2914 domain-containing protein [Reichenbachiella sp.]MDW3211354.1 DUF2914 domain-containing protein [Reichenbachiella sp.]